MCSRTRKKYTTRASGGGLGRTGPFYGFVQLVASCPPSHECGECVSLALFINDNLYDPPDPREPSSPARLNYIYCTEHGTRHSEHGIQGSEHGTGSTQWHVYVQQGVGEHGVVVGLGV